MNSQIWSLLSTYLWIVLMNHTGIQEQWRRKDQHDSDAWSSHSLHNEFYQTTHCVVDMPSILTSDSNKKKSILVTYNPASDVSMMRYLYNECLARAFIHVMQLYKSLMYIQMPPYAPDYHKLLSTDVPYINTDGWTYACTSVSVALDVHRLQDTTTKD